MRTSESSRRIAWAGVLVANLVTAFDAIALSVAIPTIAEDLRISTDEAYWAGTSFVLASAACQPLYPAFSTAWGQRPTLLAAITIFIVGTIVCGTAQNGAALLVGRTVQGVGCGGVLAMMYVVMVSTFSLRQRAIASSHVGLTWMIGLSLGPIMGGGFTTHVTWRWIFWICLPFMGIGFVVTTIWLREDKRPGGVSDEESKDAGHARVAQSTWKDRDWFGAVLLILCLCSFLVPITWGGVTFSWSSWHTLVPLILGAVGLAAWMGYELSVPEHPIMPLSIFRHRTTSCAFFGIFVAGFISAGLTFYLPLYYQVVKGYSALISGVALLPVTALSSLTTIATGLVITKLGKYKAVLLSGWAVLALGCGLLVDLEVHSSIPQWVFLNVPAGFGIGWLYAGLSVATQAPVRNEDMLLTATLSPFMRAVGQAVGIAVGNGVVQNVLRNRLSTSTVALLRENHDVIAANMASPAFIHSYTDQGAAVKSELLSAYADALRVVWWLTFALALAGLLTTFLISDISLDRAAQVPGPSDTSEHQDGASQGAVAPDKEAAVTTRSEDVNA